MFSCEFCEIFKNIEHLWWLLLVLTFYYLFIYLFCCYCLFFPFVIIFNDWLLLGKSYFSATTLSKIINNQIKKNFRDFRVFNLGYGSKSKTWKSRKFLFSLLISIGTFQFFAQFIFFSFLNLEL